MYFRLMGKLNARRNGTLAENEKGFTLIELLVVVIIIGILAAIAIPVYLGVQNNAKDSAVKTDITNLKTALVSFETSAGSLPNAPVSITTAVLTTAPTGYVSTPSTLPTDTWKAAGVTYSQYTKTLTYQITGTNSDGFCIQGDSATGKHFFATDGDGVAQGTCPTATP